MPRRISITKKTIRRSFISSPLSHLHYHKFKHNFQDTLNVLLHWWKDIDTSSHYLLHYHYFTNERSTFLNSIKEIGPTNLIKSDSYITNIPLFDKTRLLQK